jgi:hypothetical protein
LFIYSLKDVANPVKPVKDLKEIHLGISYTSSFLKSHDHHTELFVATKKTERRSSDESIRSFQPDLICFTAVASEYDFISNIAKYIKDNYPHIYLLERGVRKSKGEGGNTEKVLFKRRCPPNRKTGKEIWAECLYVYDGWYCWRNS